MNKDALHRWPRSRAGRRLLLTLAIIGGLLVVISVISLLVALLLVTGAGWQWFASMADRRAYPAPGELVDVGGYRLHIYCMGEGSPTVILAGLVVHALQMGASLVGMQMGFGLGQLFDPLTGEQTETMSQFYTLLVTLVFFAVNGHHIVIVGLLRTFEVVPAGSADIALLYGLYFAFVGASGAGRQAKAAIAAAASAR